MDNRAVYWRAERGRIRVVDLTTTLGPETPVIDLPPMFAASPAS
jgi:hypothetical protein